MVRFFDRALSSGSNRSSSPASCWRSRARCFSSVVAISCDSSFAAARVEANEESASAVAVAVAIGTIVFLAVVILYFVLARVEVSTGG